MRVEVANAESGGTVRGLSRRAGFWLLAVILGLLLFTSAVAMTEAGSQRYWGRRRPV